MAIIIRPARQSDCVEIRPLQKEIADLHHEGRPDLFREEARYYSEEAFAEKLSAEALLFCPNISTYTLYPAKSP